MIAVARTTRATGKTLTQEFSTERGAQEFVYYSLYDHSNCTGTICKQATALIMGLAHHVHQTEFGPFLFTVSRINHGRD